MLRDPGNDGKEKERLIHAPQEDFEDSQEPSVFGTFYRNNGQQPAPQERLYSNMEDPDSPESSDDEVKRPLFLSFKANDPAQDVSEALREQNNIDSLPIEDTEPLEDPTLSDEQIFDPVASEAEFFDDFQDNDPYMASKPEAPVQPAPSAPARPSIMETMYAKEDYLSNIPKYEVDNSLEDEINASLGSESFSPFQPFAAFRPAPEPVLEPVAPVEPVAPFAVEAPTEPVAPFAVSQEDTEKAKPETAPEEQNPVEESSKSDAEPLVSESSEQEAEKSDVTEEEAPAQSSTGESTENTNNEEDAESIAPSPVFGAAVLIDETPAFARENTQTKAPVYEDILADEESPIINVSSMEEPEEETETESETVSETSDESSQTNEETASDNIEATSEPESASVSESSENESSSDEPAESPLLPLKPEESSAETSEAEPAKEEQSSAEASEVEPAKAETPAEDTSSLYDTAPIEEPSMDDNSEGYESIYRESDKAVEETPTYAAPQVHPNVSIASTNLVPIDRVYNQPRRPAKKTPEEDSGKVTQNHLLFGDEDEETFHKAANERIEQNKRAKDAAAAAAAVASANATEVTIKPTGNETSNLRPGSSLGNKPEGRPAAEAASQSPAKPVSTPASTQRPGAGMSRPGAVSGMSTSAQVAKTQHHSYTAASQRGSITPVEQQEHVIEHKRSVAKPIIFICLGLLCLGGLVFCWFHFDLGKSLSSKDKKSPATTYTEKETEGTKGTKVIEVSSDTSEEPTTTTTEEPTTTTTEEPTTTTEEPTTTTTEEPTTTTTEEPTTTTTEEPTTTTTEKPTTTEPPVTVAPSDYPVTSFSYKITNAKVNGNNCSFDLKLTNSGSKTSTLNASIKSITIKFNTSVTINEVTCTNFTVTPKEGKKNTFILTPNSNEEVAKKGSITASIEGAGSAHISTFTITGVYIEYNK